jgi:uncharacterized protein YdaT
MTSSALANPDTTHNDLAEKRRASLAKQLASAVSRKASADELAGLLEIDDQLSAMRQRLDRAELGNSVSEGYINDLYGRSNTSKERHAHLTKRVDEIEARTHQAFRRADEVMDGHTADIALLIETSNIHSGQIREQARQHQALETMVGEKLILSQLDRDKLGRHEAAVAELRQRLEAIEAYSRRPHPTREERPLAPKVENIPLGTQIVLWTGALATVGAAIYMIM